MKKCFPFLIFLMGSLFAEEPPKYLYKVLSSENWEASQSQERLRLPPEDDAFIHLAKEDQLESIRNKFWKNVPTYIILKLETARLPGRLVYEVNPGGTNKYYHLYEGFIPRSAVVDYQVFPVPYFGFLPS